MQQIELQDLPRPKRRKIQLACNKCRNRKTRCDGRRPACLACLERGLEADCTYETNSLSTLNKSYGRLEQQHCRAVVSALESSDESSGARLSAGSESTSHPIATSSHGRTSATADPKGHPAQSVYTANDCIVVDGLATVAFSRDDENLYGESSTIAFVRHVMHGKQPHEHRKIVSAEPETIRDRDETLAIYPRRQTADDYLFSFWEFVHPVFPILHKELFMLQYGEIWSSESYNGPNKTNSVDEVAFSAALNLTFALGCQFSSLVAANRRMAVADEFYQRARKIFIYDVLDTSSMPVLQMLLLTGVYLQSTRYSERCWNTVGLAIRAAQTLGLHSESARRPDRQVNREIGRRVWHVCVTLDRLLAMTFGRPAMITRSWDTPCPLMIDDEFLQADGDGQQPLDTPSRMGLFVFSSKLYDILDKILITLYTEPDAETTLSKNNNLPKLLSNALIYNRQLDDFYNSIPEYLRLPATEANSSIHAENSNVQLQSRILNCRFLYTRIILLRPLLLMSTQNSLRHEATEPDSLRTITLDRELANQACILCIGNAQELAESLRQNIDTPYRISPWHTVYLSFAVAIILIAAQRSSAINLLVKQETLDVSLDHCITILAHYELQIHSACQARQALQNLRNQTKFPQSQHNSCHRTGTGSPRNSMRMSDGPLKAGMETFSEKEPPHEWWGEVIPNTAEYNPETWFSQHLINLDWPDLDWPDTS